MKLLSLMLFFAAALLSRGADINFVASSTAGYTEVPAGVVRVRNPGSTSLTVRPWNNPNLPSQIGKPYLDAGFFNNSVTTVPPASYVDVPIAFYIMRNNQPAGTYSYTLSFTGGNLANSNYSLSYPLVINKVISITLGSGATTSPTPAILTEVYISAPPPSGKITVNADANAAGPRYARIVYTNGGMSALAPFNLVEGVNVPVLTDNPASFNASETWQVVQMVGATPTVIGSVVIQKDSNGNFDLTVDAVGIPVSGTISAQGYVGLNGEGRIVIDGVPTDSLPFAFTGTAATVATKTFTPASLVAAGATATLEYRVAAPDEWKIVATAQVAKSQDGSFAVLLQARGEGDPEPPSSTAATFELDVMSFDPSAKLVQLEINGQLFTGTGSTVGGDPQKGLRSKVVIQLPGDPQLWAGMDFKWVMTGTINGQPYEKLTVAAGKAPDLYASDYTGDRGFLSSVSATLGAPTLDPAVPPTLTYNPAAADPADPAQAAASKAKRDMYEATRKAMEDALNPGKPRAVGEGPSPREGEGVARATSNAGAGLDARIKSATSNLPAISAGGNYGLISSITFSLPPLGNVTMDLLDYEPWPSVIRMISLAFLSYWFAVSGLKVFKSAFAGK